jgi:DNA (cytosine-5)-methyltransferase 1
MGTVIRALEERGYSVAWRVLDAQHFGVAQRRRRVFIIGNLGDDWRSLAEILAIGESSARYSEQSNAKRKETTRATSKSTRTFNESSFGQFRTENNAATLKASGGVLGGGSETLLIQPFVKIIRSGARAEDGSLPAEVWAERDTAPTLNVMDNNGETFATVLNVDPTFFYAKSHQDVRIQGDVINTLAATMGTGGGNTPMVHAIQNTVIGRKDTSGPQGKGYGNEEDPMFTLDTTSPHAVATAATVRRLTPTECERLQGFPDGWTEGQADSHRYKQLGNAVAVPVVEWIIQRFIQATN